MGDFQKLKVWQESKQLAVEVYKAVERNESLSNDFRLASQMTSCAVSIPSNIAEGDERNTIKQGIIHLYIAKGSCAELITQLHIAFEIGKLDKESYENLLGSATKVSATCLLYTSPSPRDRQKSRMPSSA